jgi:hypothetical protein
VKGSKRHVYSPGFKLFQVFLVVSVSLVGLTTLPSNGYGDEWVLIKRDENISSYYNSSSIKIDKENKIIKVWVKDIFTEKGRINYLKDLGSIRQKYYEDIKWELFLYSINYNNRQWCINVVKRYSKSGAVLFDVDYPIKWHNIEDGNVTFNKILQDYQIAR